ncbi:MAG: phosphotransferase family protein [Chloroflexi bacterium]|nr:phosphotransferase family protein [Chloroflexota bacterium]MCC6893328.1 phosphotransferase family protein [Anaerolineae bacterium]
MTTPASDTIAVRADEGLDEPQLAAYLCDLLPAADQPLTVRQFGGGASNLTYLLDYGTHQYVLRRPPLGPVAPSAHDMSREYRVLSVLHRAFPYAPQAFVFCDDLSVIGAPFFVMERKQGVVVRRSLPDAYAALPDAPQQMSFALVDALADLHAVNYAELGLETLGKPDGFIERQVEGWYGRWQKAKADDLPDMDAVYAWLKANLPPTAAASLVHNDYKLDNVMLAPDNPARLVAVFDWDMCTLGDPLADLGTLLTYWTEPNDPPYLQMTAMMPVGDSRFPTRAELVTRYAERSGRDISPIRFYHTLGLFRLVVICAQIYIRYKRGQTQDQRFESFGPMITLLAQAARDLTTSP